MKRVFLNESGLSMMEVIVAMLVLTLIVFAVTPLLLNSLKGIIYAGDKSEALYEGQSELEVAMAEREMEFEDQLTFKFSNPENPDTIIKVHGKNVDVLKEKGEASTWLSSFVPHVPAINLSPSSIIEGYDSMTIAVKGRYTDFEEAGEVKISESETESTKYTANLENVVSYNNNNQQEAEFTLEKGLTNSNSPYIVSTSWEVDPENEIEITVQARLHVEMPLGVTVGGGQRVLASADAEKAWNERGFIESGSGTFNDVFWTGTRYVAVTDNGKILAWANQETPELHDDPVYESEELKAITYGDGKYLIVGNNGLVLGAGNTEDLTAGNADKIEVNTDNHLYTVKWVEPEDKFVALGANGTIISSEDIFNSWDLYDWEEGANDADPENVNLQALDYNDSYVLAVGKNVENSDAVVYKADFSDWQWEQVALKDNQIEETESLNDIIYNGEKFIAVGDGGRILTTDDGEEWELINDFVDSNSDPTSLNEGISLNHIDRASFDEDENLHVVVGDDGTILTWSGKAGDDWVLHDSDIGQDLKSVALKWRRY